MNGGFWKVFHQRSFSKQYSFFQNAIPEATNFEPSVSFRWRQGCRSNIISVVKVTPLKEFAQNSLKKFLIESSINKSVAAVDSPQAFLWKFVEVFV